MCGLTIKEIIDERGIQEPKNSWTFWHFFKRISEKERVVIHKISKDESEQRSFYRLLNNQRFDIESVKSFIYDDCARQLEAGKHYLCIQDTTQPNFNRNRKNIRDKSGLGVIVDGESLGFFLRPSIVVDADDSRAIRYSHIETWSRESTRAKSEEEKKPQPIKKTFTAVEMECLEAINREYEGRTIKQKNPYAEDSLQWCYWVLARMSGWKPNEKQAGVISLTRGYADFQKILDGWNLFKNNVS